MMGSGELGPRRDADHGTGGGTGGGEAGGQINGEINRLIDIRILYQI